MTATDRKPSSNTGFLFVNRDANNIHTKGHIGAVNAHVHADARAKRKRKPASAQQQSAESAQPIQQGIRSWRIGKFPNHTSVASPTPTVNDAPEDGRTDSTDHTGPVSPALSIVSLCNSPSTAPESGPSTPREPAPPLTVQAADKRSLARRTGRQQPRRSQPPKDVPDVAEDTTQQSTESAISTYVGSTSLDPFAQIPGETTQTDRALAQYYLNSMGSLVYGTRPDALFCPVRDVTYSNISSSNLVAQWVFIGSEVHLAQRRGLPEPPSLLRRKAQTYREMNRNLSHPVERCSEATFAAIAGAIIVDSRAAGPKVASLHLRGLEMLVRSRGGLESFYRENPTTYSVFFFVWAHHACGGGGLSDLSQLQLYNAEFIQTLRDMQCWNRKLRQDLKRLSVHRLWHGGAPSTTQANARASRGSQQSHESTLEAYASSRDIAFSPSSILRPLLDPDYPCDNTVETTCHFSNLYTLNLTLWTFREDHVAGAAFLHRVLKHMTDNGRRDPVSGMTSLTLAALVWMLRKARVEVDDLGDGELSQSREVWMSWKIIHGLKVMALLGEGARKELVRMMAGWLVREELEGALEMGEEELGALGQEVFRNWEANPG